MPFMRRVEGSAENTDLDRNRSLFNVYSFMHDVRGCKEEGNAFDKAHNDAVDVERHCSLCKNIVLTDDAEAEASVASELKHRAEEIGGL